MINQTNRLGIASVICHPILTKRLDCMHSTQHQARQHSFHTFMFTLKPIPLSY